MATNLYLRDAAPTLWPGTPRFTVKDAARAVTPGSETFSSISFAGGLHSLNTSIGSGAGIAYTRASVTGPTSGILISAVCWMSDPLAAAATISGTVNFDVCGLEASMNANATFRVALYRVDQEGALSLIINSALGTELGTALARHSWSGSPTSTACGIGDRLLVLVMFDDATAVTMASGHTLTMQGDGANASTADSRLVLTENLTFLTSNPSGTTYYIRDTASDVSGAKALSTTQGSGTAEAVHTTINGPHTFPGDQWTATAGGSDIEWFTPTLSAFTLSGVVMATLSNNGFALESPPNPSDCLTCEIAVCDSDGTNAVVWARSYTSTAAAADDKIHYLTGPATSVAQGKRLRLRFFSDDFYANTQVAGTDRAIRYDGTSTYASRLIFTQTITEFVDTPARWVPPYVTSQAVIQSHSW